MASFFVQRGCIDDDWRWKRVAQRPTDSLGILLNETAIAVDEHASPNWRGLLIFPVSRRCDFGLRMRAMAKKAGMSVGIRGKTSPRDVSEPQSR
jgi:hypothetical protein